MRFLSAVVLTFSRSLHAAPKSPVGGEAMTADCAPGEIVLANCVVTPRKSRDALLVCGSKDISATEGTAQLRFGRVGAPPTLVLPELPEHPSRFGTATTKFNVLNLGGAYMREHEVELELNAAGNKVVISSITSAAMGGNEEDVTVSVTLNVSGKQRSLSCAAGWIDLGKATGALSIKELKGRNDVAEA